MGTDAGSVAKDALSTIQRGASARLATLFGQYKDRGCAEAPEPESGCTPCGANSEPHPLTKKPSIDCYDIRNVMENADDSDEEKRRKPNKSKGENCYNTMSSMLEVPPHGGSRTTFDPPGRAGSEGAAVHDGEEHGSVPSDRIDMKIFGAQPEPRDLLYTTAKPGTEKEHHDEIRKGNLPIAGSATMSHGTGSDAKTIRLGDGESMAQTDEEGTTAHGGGSSTSEPSSHGGSRTTFDSLGRGGSEGAAVLDGNEPPTSSLKNIGAVADADAESEASPHLPGAEHGFEKEDVLRASEHGGVAALHAEGGGGTGVMGAASSGDNLRHQNDADDMRSDGGDGYQHSSGAGEAIPAATSFLGTTVGAGGTTVEEEEDKERVRGQDDEIRNAAGSATTSHGTDVLEPRRRDGVLPGGLV